MTQPGSPGNSAPDQSGIHALRREITDLRRRIDAMQPQLVDRGVIALPIAVADDGGSTYQQNVLNTWVQGSMSLSVKVSNTGKLLVIAGGELTTQPTTGQSAVMAWALDGPTPVAQSASRCLFLVSGGSGVTVGAGVGACYPHLHTGLTPGVYTITDWYTTFGNLASGFGPIFSNRTLIAIPL